MAKPIALESEILILCEGAADQNFIQALVKHRGDFPRFDYLDPDVHHGQGNFGKMIEAAQGDMVGFRRLRGILIVMDSCDVPLRTLTKIRRQLRNVNFAIRPKHLATVEFDDAHQLGVSVIALPDESTPGSLESLLSAALSAKHQWLDDCVDAFLGCGESVALSLKAEPRAKARFQCMVAAANSDDPSCAASRIFKWGNFISLSDPVFDNVAQRVRDFVTAVGVAA